MNAVVSKILSVFENRGSEKYADEEVTQLEHALQCACLASGSATTSDSLVAAALLHDIGHILGHSDLPSEINSDLDDRHEQIGYAFLRQHFIDAVSEPVRLHVAAKRYLCTVDPDYRRKLSPTSLKSFQDQGGEMSAGELDEFEAEEFFEAALCLRRWDDSAKQLESPEVRAEDFLPQIESTLSQG